MRNLIIISLFALAISACDLKEDYEVERSASVEINGEYFVTLDMLDSTEWLEDPYDIGFTMIKITNTANNDPDSVWLDDMGNSWTVKAKIIYNLENHTFEPGTFNANYAIEFIAKEDTTDEGDFELDVFKEGHPINYSEVSVDRLADTKDSVLVSGYGMTVRVISGSLEIGTFEAPSKTMTDAINIELEFGDDPGTTYRYKGYRRTGFLEDEH